MSKHNVVSFTRPEAAMAEEARRAAAIVAGIRAGDTHAESAMIERYSRGLGFLLARRIGDEERARDLLQDTFCIALEKLRSIDLDKPERLAGYLRGIAIRVALHASRRRAREPLPMSDELIVAMAEQEATQLRNIAQEQTSQVVRDLLDEMHVERDRDLLLRYFVYDQDKPTICQALELDSLHFNRVLFRAKARFRKLVDRLPDRTRPTINPGEPA